MGFHPEVVDRCHVYVLGGAHRHRVTVVTRAVECGVKKIVHTHSTVITPTTPSPFKVSRLSGKGQVSPNECENQSRVVSRPGISEARSRDLLRHDDSCARRGADRGTDNFDTDDAVGLGLGCSSGCFRCLDHFRRNHHGYRPSLQG